MRRPRRAPSIQSAPTTRASIPPACWAPPAFAPSSRPAPKPPAARWRTPPLRGAAGRGGGPAAAGQRPARRHGSRQGRRAAGAEAAPAAGGAAPAGDRSGRRPGAAEPQALIVAGLGAHRAGAKAELEQLADRIGALLVTSARGKDMFRGHPCNLGIVGSFSHSAARRMIDQADCVLVFGAGLNLLTMSFGHSLPKVPLIQVDADRGHIGRWHPADVAVVGDARLAAQALLEALPPGSNADRPFRSEETLRFLRDFDIARDFEPANTPRTVDPRALGVALEKLLPANRNLVYDAGNFLGIVPYLSVPGPGHFKLTSDFASIGLGFGTALWAWPRRGRTRPPSW